MIISKAFIKSIYATPILLPWSISSVHFSNTCSNCRVVDLPEIKPNYLPVNRLFCSCALLCCLGLLIIVVYMGHLSDSPVYNFLGIFVSFLLMQVSKLKAACSVSVKFRI